MLHDSISMQCFLQSLKAMLAEEGMRSRASGALAGPALHGSFHHTRATNTDRLPIFT